MLEERSKDLVKRSQSLLLVDYECCMFHNNTGINDASTVRTYTILPVPKSGNLILQ